jgi:hypothetical protein
MSPGSTTGWVAQDATGRIVLSRKVANDQHEIERVLADARALADRLVWTVDLTTVEAALLAVLWSSGQRAHYLSGRAVNHAAVGYRGEGKTDARDARVIADQARMRHDLPVLRPGEDLVVELRMLTGRRADLVADRTRTLNRLRQHLTAVCPTLECAAKLASQRGWVVLLARYRRPKAIRRAGAARLAGVLTAAGLRADTAHGIAEAAVAAARTQTARPPGEEVAAGLVAALAEEVLDLDARISSVDAALQARFRRHPLAEVICSSRASGSGSARSSVRDRRPGPDRLRRPTGRLRRPGAGHQRLGQGHRPAAPTPPLQPGAAARYVPGGAERGALRSRFQGVLPAQARREQGRGPSGHLLGPPRGQRAVGTTARPPHLAARTAPQARRRGQAQGRSTTSLRLLSLRSAARCWAHERSVRLGILDRFRPFRFTGSSPYHYVLGELGAQVLVAERGLSVGELGYSRTQTLAIAHSQHLAHQVGVNGFFAALAAGAARRPDATLLAWWSERRCAQRWGRLVPPDGFGRWTEAGRTVEFFLEWDAGTETVARVAGKPRGYADLAAGSGIWTPTLLWLPSPPARPKSAAPSPPHPSPSPPPTAPPPTLRRCLALHRHPDPPRPPRPPRRPRHPWRPISRAATYISSTRTRRNVGSALGLGPRP